MFVGTNNNGVGVNSNSLKKKPKLLGRIEWLGFFSFYAVKKGMNTFHACLVMYVDKIIIFLLLCEIPFFFKKCLH